MTGMSGVPLYQVDAFSSEPFKGNPAAVALLSAEGLPDELMQSIAAEMNQSETAFVQPMAVDNLSTENAFATASCFKLRWFTPTTEVPMCGHATLASAAVLFQEYKNPSKQLQFNTKSGPLLVCRVDQQNDGQLPSRADGIMLQMCLPLAYYDVDALPPPFHDMKSKQAQGLLRACVGDLKVKECVYTSTNNLNYVLVRLDDTTTRQQLEAIQPDIGAMSLCADANDIHGVIVTCQGDDPGYDFLSRFFAPWMGINEDAVTGSAHTVLGPFWSARLEGKGSLSGSASGMTKMPSTPIVPLRARQCSKRGGDLSVQLHDCQGQVLISGNAVIVMHANLRL